MTPKKQTVWLGDAHEDTAFICIYCDLKFMVSKQVGCMELKLFASI
jgi:hypothetical protein